MLHTSTLLLCLPAQDGVRLSRRFMPFPQPAGLPAALLEAQLWVLGKMVAVVGPQDQAAVLEVRCHVGMCLLRRFPSLSIDLQLCTSPHNPRLALRDGGGSVRVALFVTAHR